MTLRNVTTGVFAFFILFDLWVSAGLWLGRALGGDAEDGDSAGWQWGVPFLLAAIVLGYALRVRDEHPQRSTVLMIVGATIPMVTFYWMVPIFVPFWLVAAGLAIASEPGRRTPAPAV